MTLSLWQLLVVVLVPLLLGTALLRLQGVTPRLDPLAFGGWAWIQGCLGLAVVLSAWLWLELPLRGGWIALVLVVLAGVAFGLGCRVRSAEASTARKSVRRFPAWERAFFAAVLGALLLASVDRLLLAANNVLATSDEAIIWAAKAKVLFHTGGFGAGFRAALATGEFISHPDYPPLNPLLQVWVHALAGEIVHVESRLPIQVFGLASLWVAASALRRRARPLVAALFLVCLETLGGARFAMTQVFSDLLIATSCLVCWDLWQRYQEDGQDVWLRLLASAAPLLVWSKNEGLLHVLVFVLALFVAALWRRAPLRPRRKLWPRSAWAAPLVLSVLYLQGFNAHFGLVNDLVGGVAELGGVAGPGGAEFESAAPVPDDAGFLRLVRAHGADNLGPIFASFASLIGTQPSQTRYLLLVFLGLLVVSPQIAFGHRRRVFTLGLLVTLLGYMLVYLGTHWQIEVHLKHSAHRLVYHLLPAAGLWVLLYVVEVLPGLAAEPTPFTGTRPGP